MIFYRLTFECKSGSNRQYEDFTTVEEMNIFIGNMPDFLRVVKATRIELS